MRNEGLSLMHAEEDDMAKLDAWISEKLQEIAHKLPNLVHSDPASFACGFNSGYKQAMLDLNRFIEVEKVDPDALLD